MPRLLSWFRDRHGPSRSLSGAARLALESLEAREVPATYLVTNTNPAGPGSLAVAVANANSNPGFDQVLVSASGVLNLPATLTITDSVEIRSVGSANFVIDGGGVRRLFDVQAPTTLRGLTLRNGFVSGVNPNDVNGYGGAIRAYAPLTVLNCTLTGNTARFGGAIFSFSNVLIEGGRLTNNSALQTGGAVSVSGANLTVRDAEVRNNVSQTGVGGGLAVYAGNVLVERCVITDNSAVSGGGLGANTSFGSGGGNFSVIDSVVARNGAANNGGGIYTALGSVTVINSRVNDNTANTDAGSTLSLAQGGGIWAAGNVSVRSGSQVNGNRALGGGGIYVQGSSGVLLQVQSGSQVSNNIALGDNGGGLWAQSADVSVTSATVRNNLAFGDGGGLYVSGGNVSLNAATVSGNRAGTNGLLLNTTGDGGGVYLDATSLLLSVVNSTVSGNQAVNAGGGLYTAGGLLVLNSTVVLNRTTAPGSSGGGLYGQANPIYLESTIVAGNTANTTPNDIDALTDAVTSGSQFNLIGNAATAGGLTDGVNNNIVGVGGVGTRPIASIIDVVLKNNGGPTETHRLAFGSAAVDAGSNPNALLTDQRGANRVIGPAPDIGATEGTTVWTNAIAWDRFVNVYDSIGSLVTTLNTGLPSVRLAIGDVTSDGRNDIVAGSGRGAGAVLVYDGATLSPAPLKTLFPYGSSYTQGLTVATGDVDGDGDTDIVVGPGTSGLQVRVLDYATSANGSAGSAFASFNPFYNNAQASKYQNGVRVAAGDLNGDGDAEVVVSTASPQAALVQVFDYSPGSITKVAGKTVATNIRLTHQFAAAFAGSGAYTAVLGPGQIVVGSGSGPARFQVFNLVSSGSPTGVGTANPVSSSPFAAFSNPGSTQEVRVAVRDIDGNGTLELLAATGPNGAQQVRVFDASTLALQASLGPVALFIPPTYTAGLFV